MAKTVAEPREKPVKARGRLRLILRTVLVTALVCAGVFLFFYFRAPREAPPPEITSQLIIQKISGMSELATVRYLYTSVGKFESSSDFYGYTIPFTKKTFLLSYGGIIKAGVDLKAVQAAVSPSAIVLTLPKAVILSHEVDYDSFQIFDETKNIFNPITLSDYAAFFSDERVKMETQAVDGGLLEEADAQAKESLRAFLTSLDILAEDQRELVFR